MDPVDALIGQGQPSDPGRGTRLAALCLSLGTGTSTQMAEGQDADGMTEVASGYE